MSFEVLLAKNKKKKTKSQLDEIFCKNKKKAEKFQFDEIFTKKKKKNFKQKKNSATIISIPKGHC